MWGWRAARPSNYSLNCRLFHHRCFRRCCDLRFFRHGRLCCLALVFVSAVAIATATRLAALHVAGALAWLVVATFLLPEVVLLAALVGCYFCGNLRLALSAFTAATATVAALTGLLAALALGLVVLLT